MATWKLTAAVKPTSVKAGSTTKFKVTATVRASTAPKALVDIEVYDPTGKKAYQTWFDAQSFSANVNRTFSVTWTAPSGPIGTWTVKVGVFTVGWGTQLAWNNGAASLLVTR